MFVSIFSFFFFWRGCCCLGHSLTWKHLLHVFMSCGESSNKIFCLHFKSFLYEQNGSWIWHYDSKMEVLRIQNKHSCHILYQYWAWDNLSELFIAYLQFFKRKINLWHSWKSATFMFWHVLEPFWWFIYVEVMNSFLSREMS